MTKPFKYDPKWVEAKNRCRLNQDDIAKAKELGLTPKALLKNIPSPQQKWKQPVKFWIRELYEKKFTNKRSTPPDRGTLLPDRSTSPRIEEIRESPTVPF